MIYEELLSFDRKGFFRGAPEETVKMYDYREQVLECVLKRVFEEYRLLSSAQSSFFLTEEADIIDIVEKCSLHELSQIWMFVANASLFELDETDSLKGEKLSKHVQNFEKKKASSG